MARTRLVILDLCVLAVWHLREEDGSVALRVELALGFVFDFLVVAGAWVVAWWELLVLDVNRRLKHLPRRLRRLEVADRSSVLADLVIRVVQGRAYRVEAASSVHIDIDFLGGDGGGLRLNFVDLGIVRLALVLIPRLVQLRGQPRKLQALEVGTGAGVGQVRRRLVTA